jgi:hypothetical protein
MTSTTSTSSAAPAVGGVHTVRRVITYSLLAITVIIAASGLSSLVERLLTVNSVEVSFDNYDLATSLAFALIAGPLAALLWWLTWRDSANARDRASIIWPVYLVILSTVALITSTTSLFSWAAGGIVNGWQPYGLAVGVVWGLVWVWHYWMWRHPRKGPTRLQGAADAIASIVGLIYAAGGVAFAVGTLVDSAVDSILGTVVISDPVWQLVLQSLVWAIGGGLLWWWHWFRVGVRTQSFGFSNVLLVFVAGIASIAAFAVGMTLTLSVILELVTGSPQPIAVTLEPLGVSLATAAVGALVVIYHAPVITKRSTSVRSATRLASAGVSLAVAATGVGVTVNALLASSSSAIIAGDIRNLLLGGLSALVVGGVLWWATWSPRRASTPERVTTPGRRAYLVVIFGLSALVALITLLGIGFQLFSFLLDGGSGETFIERSRQALGLLTATVLVASYHFAIWRNDRVSDVAPENVRRIDRVTLVTSIDSAELVDAVRSATGARVTALLRADALKGEADVAAIVAALDGVEIRSVLVIAGARGKVEVIPLKG